MLPASHVPERSKTDRQAVLNALTDAPASALEISGLAGVSEKSVYDQLKHLMRSKELARKIGVEPSECIECGFRFVKRDKLTKPGRCPTCKGRRIAPARFFIKTGSR